MYPILLRFRLQSYFHGGGGALFTQILTFFIIFEVTHVVFEVKNISFQVANIFAEVTNIHPYVTNISLIIEVTNISSNSDYFL